MAKKAENLPIGIGGEKLAEGRETLPAVEVKNVVEWVNPHIQAPFDLRKGKPSRLGMFLTTEPDESAYELEVHPEHGRSGIIGRVIFRDDEGRLYRDVDVKGVGHAVAGKQHSKVFPVRIDDGFWAEERTYGILYGGYARSDIEMTEKFLKAGIRTCRNIAMIKLKDIICGGERLSVEEAGRKGIIKKDDDPVVLVRAFGTRTRLGDVNQKNALEDARLLVAQEFGFDPKEFHTEEYLKWIVKTAAQNIARMHRHGWLHGYLSDHNITLDGRIVDLDSVVTEEEAAREKDESKKKSRNGDCEQAWMSLERVINRYLDNSRSAFSDDGVGFRDQLRVLYRAEYSKEITAE